MKFLSGSVIDSESLIKTNNNQELEHIMSDSELEHAKQIVSKIFDSAAIRNWQIKSVGRQFKILITSEFHLPRVCLTELESNGYPVQTFHSGEQGLEIIIGGNTK